MLSAPISNVVDEHTWSWDMAKIVVEGYSIVGKEHCKLFTNKRKLSNGQKSSQHEIISSSSSLLVLTS
jgi:hypothetical protein